LERGNINNKRVYTIQYSNQTNSSSQTGFSAPQAHLLSLPGLHHKFRAEAPDPGHPPLAPTETSPNHPDSQNGQM